MKIKLIAVILVFISSFFGTTVEALAPSEPNLNTSSYYQDMSVEAVCYNE